MFKARVAESGLVRNLLHTRKMPPARVRLFTIQSSSTCMGLVCNLLAVMALSSCVLTITSCKTPEQKAAAFVKHGKALLEKKDYPRAMLEFQNAAKLRPADSEALYQLAVTYLQMGDVGSGIRTLKRVTELNPKHVQAQLTLAELMARSRNPKILEEAKKRAEQAAANTSDNGDAMATLAEAEIRLGDVTEGEKHLRETLARFPDSLKTSVTLA